MIEAFAGWRELEADAGLNLFVRTGGVSFTPPGSDYVRKVTASLAAVGIPHRRMIGAEWNRANPAFSVPDDDDAVFEPDAGMLAASKILATQAALGVQHGGRLLEECPIRRIVLDAERPTLLGDGLRITTDRLIVAAGPWMGSIFPEFAKRLRPTRQQVLYFRPADASPFAVGRFPVFIFMGAGADEAFYGMPDYLGCGVKAARHGGPDADPDRPDREIGEEYRGLVRRFLRGHIPALAEAPVVRSEVCFYTRAPEDRFLIGAHATRPDVIVASPCSGHGFKFSNLIGRVLADLAVEGRTSVDIEPWQLAASSAP